MPYTDISQRLHTGATIISVDEVKNRYVQFGVNYWRSLCGQRYFPARADLTLRGMASILPFVIIVEVIGGGADFEYRYIGDAQRQAYGADLKGVRVTQIEATAPEFGGILRSAYEKIRSSGEPFAIRGRTYKDSTNTQFPYHETALLPLGATAAVVDHVLIVGVQIPEPFWDLPPKKLTSLSERARTLAAQS